MKLDREKYHTEGSDTLRESAIEIGDHGFVLELVMKDMYSEPVKAICREISSNCRDAHREAGKPDLPIEIVLPNAFEASIKFRDYGPGISPDRMDTIYTKVGRSTKRDDNSETGGFGLGAKTPFAYTSQFSISTISVINTQNEVDILNESLDTSYTLDEVRGKHLKCLHTASRGGGSGSGGVKLHFAELTDEGTGTEIIVPVNRQDFMKFNQGVVDSCQFWDVRPIIKGEFQWPPSHKRVVEGTGWYIIDGSNDRWGYREQRAIIDGISYPLTLGQIHGTELSDEAERVLNKIKYSSVHLEFNTGDLELVPSREAILYESRTISAISSRFEVISKEIGNKVRDMIDDASTYIEAVNIVEDFSKSVMKPGEQEWKGNKIYTTNSALNFEIPGGREDCRLYCYTINTSTNAGYSKTNRGFFNVGRKLLINDTGKSVPKAFVEKYIKDNGLEDSYPRKSFYILTSPTDKIDAVKEAINEGLGFNIDECLEPELLSAYEPEKAVTTKSGAKTHRAKPQRGTSMVWEWDANAGWVQTRINRDTDKGVYVVLSNRKTLIQDSIGGRNVCHYTLNNLLNLTDDGTKLYGVKEEVAEKLGKNFKPLKVVIDSKKPDINIPKDKAEELAFAKHRKESYYEKPVVSVIRKVIPEKLEPIDSILRELGEKITEYNKLTSLAKTLGEESPFKDVDFLRMEKKLGAKWDIESMADEIQDKYPLLDYVQTWKVSGCKKTQANVRKYVELIDSDSENELEKDNRTQKAS